MSEKRMAMAEEEMESSFVESGYHITLLFGAKRNENQEIYTQIFVVQYKERRD